MKWIFKNWTKAIVGGQDKNDFYKYRNIEFSVCVCVCVCVWVCVCLSVFLCVCKCVLVCVSRLDKVFSQTIELIVKEGAKSLPRITTILVSL